MYEKYFVGPERRERRSVEEVLDLFPKLAFDAERADEDREHTPHLLERLSLFAAYVEGHTPEPFVWDRRASEVVAPHPVYRDEAYRRGDLRDLPTLDRARLRRTQRPFDPEAAGATSVYENRTSGTSGAPLTIYYSPEHMARSLHLSLPMAAVRAGIRGLGARPVFSVLVTDNPALPHGALLPTPWELSGHRLIWHVDTADPASVDDLDTMLRLLTPEVISSKPNLFRILLEHWERAGVPAAPGPLFLASGGAMLPDRTRERLRAVFSCPVLSVYSTGEASYLGSECALGTMHLNEALHEHFESVPLEDPATGEEGLGELALTSLGNTYMPLVRYRVGDTVRLSRDTCACGAPGPVLDELRGRTTLVFDLGDGHMLSPTRYMDLFKNHSELREYQLVQRTPRSFLVRIDLIPGTPSDGREAACVRVRDAIASGMPVEAEVAWEESTLETEGTKFARFRSEVTA
ncbi:hypothetical protein ABZ635_00770 [Nocardiopsis sp. NPDC007018]|uniref:hypothetical protein n=1 Tax=Nocardiopsis sp. NPDC007018 TaxID=3155721 RepID=UPI0033EE7F1D